MPMIFHEMKNLVLDHRIRFETPFHENRLINN